MPGRRSAAGAVALLSLLVAGCAGGATDSPAPPAPVVAAADPLRLIGVWTIDGADEPGAVLRIAGEGLAVTLWRRCGRIGGTWRADENGLFVAHLNTVRGCPATDDDFTPPWLARVSRYRLDGDAPALLDEAGVVVARLRGGADPPPPIPGLFTPDPSGPPAVTDEARRLLAPAAPLPAGLAPADRAALVGRWEVGPDHTRFLKFTVDGMWGGSDGCNAWAGRWVAGPGGAILATSVFGTLVACAGPPVGTWLTETRRAAIDGDMLVLVGGDGRERGRLLRSPYI